MRPRFFVTTISLLAITLILSSISTVHSRESAIISVSAPKNYWTVPDDIPLPTVTRFDTVADTTGALAEGYIFLAPHERRPGNSIYAPYLLMIDNDGELVYHRKIEDLENHTRFDDFKLLPNGLLISKVGGLKAHQLQDASYQPAGTIRDGADMHDIQLLPNGNYMVLFYRIRRIDLSQYVEGGDSNAAYADCHLDEINAEGETVFTWNSGDHFAITDTYRSLTSSYVDAVHCNSVELDTDGNLLISNRDLYEVTKIDKETGAVIWRLGGKNNQFEFINAINAEHVLFEKQHDARRVSNGNLTLFDNRLEDYSRAVEYALDEENMTATLVWEHRRSPDKYGGILGNTQRLPNGNTLMGWGNSFLSAVEVTRTGETLLEISLPPEVATYRAYRFPWSGRPVTTPDLAVIRDVDENNATTALLLAYSWNGATEVSAYQVYGDASVFPQTLITTTPKNGFEATTILRDELLAAALDQNYNFRIMPLGLDGEPFMFDEAATEVSSSVVSIESAIVGDIPTDIPVPDVTQSYFLPLIRNLE